ncbi:MAG: hypothetical protein ACT4NL_06010 [Pseudomarimonas sp.]
MSSPPFAPYKDQWNLKTRFRFAPDTDQGWNQPPGAHVIDIVAAREAAVSRLLRQPEDPNPTYKRRSLGLP